jgi:hypothetical protein
MIRKTVDLQEILGGDVDYGGLAGCLRRGFAEEWDITFASSAGGPYAGNARQITN